MFLKCSTRYKDGKEHRSWSIVESRRLGRSVVHRHVLYLGEINDSQRAAWQKAIAVFDEQEGQACRWLVFEECVVISFWHSVLAFSLFILFSTTRHFLQ